MSTATINAATIVCGTCEKRVPQADAAPGNVCQECAATALPGRYALRYGTRGWYLDDGSNFVCWLKVGDDPVALAYADIARKDAYRAAYVEGMAAATNTTHSGCDHAYGICTA